MFKVYVLYSKSHNKIYIGYTSNIEEHLKSHNELGTKGWTIKYCPWELVHYLSKQEQETQNRKSEGIQEKLI